MDESKSTRRGRLLRWAAGIKQTMPCGKCELSGFCHPGPDELAPCQKDAAELDLMADELMLQESA